MSRPKGIKNKTKEEKEMLFFKKKKPETVKTFIDGKLQPDPTTIDVFCNKHLGIPKPCPYCAEDQKENNTEDLAKQMQLTMEKIREEELAKQMPRKVKHNPEILKAINEDFKAFVYAVKMSPGYYYFLDENGDVCKIKIREE